MDLSHLPGYSVNDGIEPELCSLAYASVVDAVAMITRLGRGIKLAKIYLEDAYRIMLVHPDDRYLLSMEWQGDWHVDKALPFNLRLAPKIFSALADGLMWIMGHNGYQWAIHYLDLFLGRPSSQQCDNALRFNLVLCLCEILGVPVSMDKFKDPATILAFLGILFDTMIMELCLPPDKLGQSIAKWKQKRNCTKQELLSLIGQLQHACQVRGSSWLGSSASHDHTLNH